MRSLRPRLTPPLTFPVLLHGRPRRSAKCPIILTANGVPTGVGFERLKCRVLPLAPPPPREVDEGTYGRG